MVNRLEDFKGQLTRSSLGRQAFIGELYNARSESLTCRSLFKSSFPPNFIERRDVKQMEFDYRFIENISDRFELINVEAELQLSVILGLVTLEGIGKFLTEEKKTEKIVSCSLLCKLQTISEKFFASFDEILQYIDLTALENPQYTHMIVEVNWGANCLLNLEHTYRSNTEKKNMEGVLLAELSLLKKWLNSIKAKGTFKKEDADSSNRRDVKIKVCADVIPDKNWPTSAEGFCDFVAELPKLLQNVNNGKGKPLNYVMIPLDSIRKLAKLECSLDLVVRKIDESFLLSTIYFFEEITKTKQKLNDLLFELNENKKYVNAEKLKNARKMYEDLCVKETELKEIISNDWVSLRAGEITLKNLIKKVETFKNRDLSLFTYEEFLESYSSTLNKISTVKNFISKGVIYLGIGENFKDVMSYDLFCEFIVLVISTKIEEADPELCRNVCYYFLTLATESKLNTKYVVIDFDFVNTEEPYFLNREITRTKCFHLKGNKVLNSDMYSDYLAELGSNYTQLGNKVSMEFVRTRPGNRAMLEMVCPGFELGNCPPNLLTWDCFRCKNKIEYGFDDYFYCFCGRGPAASFEYRCAYPKHGSFFITAEPKFLTNALSILRPLKELNLLVLGQTGVGKSTWINSIVNYLTYDSLETASEHKVICTIPVNITMFDSKTYKKHDISIGESKNENMSVGESATQSAHTYNFLWKDRYVRIIDTPGLGDTRGINQDKKNLRNIIDHIGFLKELHAVCILLKATDNKITSLFGYCIKELLVHLHKSVTKNIVFCFTNARNSLYAPGQMSVVLEKLLNGIGLEKELSLGKYNMFCLDNEAFLFLCSLENPEVEHETFLLKSYSKSWEISLNETRRLFNTIKDFKPHSLKETVTLVTARNRILTLSKPVADISKTIQINVAAIERKKKEMDASELTIKDLAQKLTYTEIHLEPVPLTNPRTVCTSPSCVEYYTYKSVDLKEIEYKTHCHVNCQLKNVTPKTINNAALKNCTAINSNGTCNVCGCRWESHMHITSAQKRVEKQMVNKFIEENMMKEKSIKEEIESFVKNLTSTIEKYKQEQEFIIQTTVKFGMFLRQNAIACYNDSVAEYLGYMIAEEEKKPYKSETDEKLLESLKETLAHYNSEVQILLEVIKKGDTNIEELTPQDVYDLEQKLYELELTGEAIRNCVSLSRSSQEKMTYYAETPLQLKEHQKKSKNLTSQLWKKINHFMHRD